MNYTLFFQDCKTENHKYRGVLYHNGKLSTVKSSNEIKDILEWLETLKTVYTGIKVFIETKACKLVKMPDKRLFNDKIIDFVPDDYGFVVGHTYELQRGNVNADWIAVISPVRKELCLLPVNCFEPAGSEVNPETQLSVTNKS